VKKFIIQQEIHQEDNMDVEHTSRILMTRDDIAQAIVEYTARRYGFDPSDDLLEEVVFYGMEQPRRGRAARLHAVHAKIVVQEKLEPDNHKDK